MARRLILSAVLTFVGVAPATARTDARSPAGPCASVTACRSELARARAAVAWQRQARHALERRLRVRWSPTARYAITLASRVFGVDEHGLLAVARCESNLDPLATNGKYRGLFQTGPGFWSATPFASFSRYDPIANALAAASVIRVQGYRQWTCGWAAR